MTRPQDARNKYRYVCVCKSQCADVMFSPGDDDDDDDDDAGGTRRRQSFILARPVATTELS